MILKGLKYFIYFFSYLIGIVCVCWLIVHLNDVLYLISGEYPGLGKYYISFMNDEERILSNVYYKHIVYNDEIDLSNLVLYVRENEEYCIEDKKSIYDDNEIRLILLENGLAEIVNKDIALSDEIEAQDKAVKSENGIWKVGSNTGKRTLHSVLYTILNLFDNYIAIALVKILSYIGIGSILLSFVGWIYKKIISNIRIDTIFMGGISSGKTTIIERLKDPNISPEKLLSHVTSTKARDVSKGIKMEGGKKYIYPRFIDNPGKDISKMLDELRKFKLNRSEKSVIVFVISFTESNKRDNDNYEYINQQIIRASTLIQILKTSKVLKKNNRIIVFFNKCDLIYDKELDFWEDKRHIKIRNKYKDSEDLKIIYRYSDCILYGSAVYNWEIDALCEKIRELC